jgi:NitT/TauT family transport system permease protein
VSIEFIGADEGIGWLIWHSWELFSIQLMFVGLLTVSFLGLVLMLALEWLEKLLVPWRL